MPPADAESPRRSARLLLMAMTLANGMILIDQTAVPIALPDIMQTFRVGSQEVQWVLSGSLLALAALLVLGGRLGDLLGRRRIFIIGSLLFAGASAVGGMAPEFWVLLVARVVQGAGGALMLPVSVAIVSAAFPADQRGRALGTMGGIAAVAGALGPTIGGVLTSALSWRAVLLVNVPIAVACVYATLRSVPADEPRSSPARIDVPGAALLGIGLVGLSVGLAQTQDASWGSIGVFVPLVLSGVAALAFVAWERRTDNPLMDLSLLGRHRNYLGATISQGLAGMAEMGLGVLFPLILILNLGMDPALAGLALIPATVPMVIGSPLVGRWYDRAGGRPPMVAGFGVLALAGVVLAWGAGTNSYADLLPGLLLYGIGLAIVLTVNDPVSLDTVPDGDQGQASGVSATAEQGGGAIGIAILYALFHTSYVNELHEIVDRSPLPDLTDRSGAALRAGLQSAEQTGLRPAHFDPTVADYLLPARTASEHGYSVAFLAVSVISLVGAAASWWLVRRPPVPGVEPAAEGVIAPSPDAA